jgi:hypothetical protein
MMAMELWRILAGLAVMSVLMAALWLDGRREYRAKRQPPKYDFRRVEPPKHFIIVPSKRDEEV